MTLDLCIFDLDGVICDTAKYHYLAWKKLSEDLNINFTIEDNERLKGVSRMDSLEIILSLGDKTYTDEEKYNFAKEKNENYVKYIENISEDEILPGVLDFIKGIKEKGIKIALGSVSKNAMTILNKLNLARFFESIVDGNKVTKAKPNPEVFLYSSRELGIPTQNCIVFEDAFEGIKAAKAAGMKNVGICPNGELTEADYTIPNFLGISIDDILKKI